MRLSLLRAAAVAAAAALPAAAGAQLTVTADASVASGYVWRGLHFTNRPVLEPEVVLSLPAAGTTYTLGGWANVQPARYTDPTALSMDAGRRGVDATTFWADAMRHVGGGRSRADVSAGVMGYWYPSRTGASAAYNTLEVYGRAALPGPLAPKLGFYMDVARIRGGYLEGSVSHAFPLRHGVSLALAGTSGVSVGQDADPSGRDLSYFARDGVAFTDLAAGLGLTLGTVSVAPTLHLVLAHDDMVRVTGPAATRGAKLWLGTNVAWSHTRGHGSH
jgi:hypothetical protein